MKRLFAVVLTLVALLAFLPQPAMAQKHHRRIDPNQVDKIQCQTHGYCGGRFYDYRGHSRDYGRRYGYDNYRHRRNRGGVNINIRIGSRRPNVVYVPQPVPVLEYPPEEIRHERSRPMSVEQGVIRLIHNRSGAPALVRVGDAPCFTLEDGGEARRVPGSPALISADLIIGTKPDGEPLTAAACIRGMAHPGHVQILPAGSQKCGG